MSSGNYANRLSEYKNKGICGLPETEESIRSLSNKLKKLLSMINNSYHIVILTGAGVSTSAGIPDFRGPNGIWTREKEEGKKRKTSIYSKTEDAKHNIGIGIKVENGQLRPNDIVTCEEKKGKKMKVSLCSKPENIKHKIRIDVKAKEEKNNTSASIYSAKENEIYSKARTNQSNNEKRISCSLSTKNKKELVSFENCKPSLTHKAITRLAEKDIVKFCITQNVDGLHMRSGLPRSKHTFLHGCIFTEKCEKCQTEYFRDFDVGGVSFKKTGRKCVRSGCNGDLRDTILDWEDELPPKDWELSQCECLKSDLIIAVGTSLRIEPVASLTTLSKKIVIVNKQITPYDEMASLVIRAPVDHVFDYLLRHLDVINVNKNTVIM